MSSVEGSNLDDDMLDVDFLSSQSSISTTRSSGALSLTAANFEVLKYIDITLDSVMSALANDQRPEVVLKRVGTRGSKQRDATQGYNEANEKEADVENGSISYAWPGKTEAEAWRFACLLAILVEIKKAIESNITVTKRDIYYHDPDLYKKQETVDRFIDDIAFTCNVTRKDLRVVSCICTFEGETPLITNQTASPKGLLCGLTSSDQVLIVPEDPCILELSTMLHLRWILVVEKEASFKALVEHKFHRSPLLGCGLVVTGKGYPDLNTKRFLRHVLDHAPLKLPILGLFDGDPDGLDIYRCYRIGSKRSRQESSSNIPEMRWLGVDLAEFLNDPHVMNEAVAMTARDRARATSMLDRKQVESGTGRREVVAIVLKQRTMLQCMLMLNIKMEIQAIDRSAGGLCGWLTERMLKMLAL